MDLAPSATIRRPRSSRAPIAAAFATRPSSLITRSVAIAAAQATGLPP